MIFSWYLNILCTMLKESGFVLQSSVLNMFPLALLLYWREEPVITVSCGCKCSFLSASVYTWGKGTSRRRRCTHSSALAWKIPWTEEPGRLQSMGSQRVGHNWVTSLSLFIFMHWRRKWQRTPVFLPGESQGRRSLVGCHLWGCTESDTTEVT